MPVVEEEREVFAIQSVRYERARIARELHDIVAHNVSLMVIQASAGELLIEADASAAAEAFVSISEAARQAEVEIGRLVAVLDLPTTGERSASHAVVEELIERVRNAGVEVSYTLGGDVDGLAEPAAVAVRRLVQEAVTNAVKHAPGNSIDISLQGDGDEVEIQVTNALAAQSRPQLAESGGGHGLSGMAERVTGCGGTFVAGPERASEWVVRARLPRRLAARL